MMVPNSLYDQILLFGDSITEFAECQIAGFAFGPAVRDDYRRRLDVVNRGLSGYNTKLGLEVLPYIMPWESRVQLMTIFLGANDSCYPVDNPQTDQCVPLDQFKRNLIDITQHERVLAHNPKIIFITPPPIDERQQWLMNQSKGFTSPRRSAKNTKAYADAVREVASSLNAPVVDMWTCCMEYAGWQPGQPLCGDKDLPVNERFLSLFVDGLHLSADGYRLLYNEFNKVIAEQLPQYLPENFPMRLPPWDQFPPTWDGPGLKKVVDAQS